MVLLSSEPAADARQARSTATFALAKPIKLSRLFDTIANAVAGVRSKPLVFVGIDHGMSTRRPLRILVAEDNVVNQKVVSALLAKMGYAPDLVADGAEAVEAVKRQTYDVILMDVQMPGTDGLEATRSICSRSGTRPWIIALTANAAEEDRRACLDAGMDDYITKPVTANSLMAALERAKPKMPPSLRDLSAV